MNQPKAQASAFWEGKNFDVGGNPTRNLDFRVYALSDTLLRVSTSGSRDGLLCKGADVICPAGLLCKWMAVIGLWLWCQRWIAKLLWSPVRLTLIREAQ